jgi:CheY-like chemotaxis protein
MRDGAADILITDLDMPGMTGLELIEEIRERSTGCAPISILLTASHVPGLKITARRLKVREVLSKPVHPQYICQIVRQILQELDWSRPNQEFDTVKKILIADDRPANVTLLSRYLEGEGYVCITANNGPETLQQIRRESPDLVLLDLKMPYEDGIAVLQEIRANLVTQHIPAIIISAAWDNAAEIRHGLNLAADDYVTKPIDRRALLSLIRKKLLANEVEQSSIVRKAR